MTGVPGAGKTLAGLNLVTHRTKAHEEEHAVFLSGNGPLVDVLREALARDEQAQAKELGQAGTKADAARKVKSFIQNIHHFRDANLQTNRAPIERVAVFDEAQRAWDKDKAANFMAQRKGVPDFDQSEPEFLISVMDRHTDWCTIVCLIGGGQEINAGEAGLTEWFSALKRRFPIGNLHLAPTRPSGLRLGSRPGRHACRSSTSNDARAAPRRVGAIIPSGKALRIRKRPDRRRSRSRPIRSIKKLEATYPIALTRDLNQAKAWLRSHARGSERFGLVASSGASRLKPEGVNVHEKITATYWFLNDKSDVRSSYYLEDPATEFDIQGLELDWVGVCWDADFRIVDSKWSHHAFRGTVWNNVNDTFRRAYLANAYRVLLTRARQGMIIYVPRGNERDSTRLPKFYDGTVKFLEQCGVPSCPHIPSPAHPNS